MYFKVIYKSLIHTSLLVAIHNIGLLIVGYLFTSFYMMRILSATLYTIVIALQRISQVRYGSSVRIFVH